MPFSRDLFPRDDDGDVLYSLAKNGVDLSLKRKIEFYCYTANVEIAEKIADDLESYGYASTVFVDDGVDGDGRVSVYSAILMMPSYDLIVLEQQRLNLLLARYGTFCDGWMTERD